MDNNLEAMVYHLNTMLTLEHKILQPRHIDMTPVAEQLAKIKYDTVKHVRSYDSKCEDTSIAMCRDARTVDGDVLALLYESYKNCSSRITEIRQCTQIESVGEIGLTDVVVDLTCAVSPFIRSSGRQSGATWYS